MPLTLCLPVGSRGVLARPRGAEQLHGGRPAAATHERPSQGRHPHSTQLYRDADQDGHRRGRTDLPGATGRRGHAGGNDGERRQRSHDALPAAR